MNTFVENAMPAAMREAGVKPPQNRVIFNWIKDHPRCGNKEIVAGLKGVVQESSIGFNLRDMWQRGMLNRDADIKHGREIYVYSVAIKEFELLPHKTQPLKKADSPPPPASAYVAPQTMPIDALLDTILELPLKDVLQLRDRLDAMFPRGQFK